VLDAFSGGSSVSFALKLRGKTVYANDVMKINYMISKALIENKKDILTSKDVDMIFQGSPFKGFVYQNYANLIYYPEECMQLDLYRSNIDELSNANKRALALSLMRRAMIRKMPYSRFNIKWEKVMQLRDEEYSYEKYGRKRAYHNLSFEYHFRSNLEKYNNAVFDNGKTNKAFNKDIFEIAKDIKADLIYLDPPYAGTMNGYYGFYNFLDNYIEGRTIPPFSNNFINKEESVALFDELLSGLSNFKYIMLSYNSSSYPGKSMLLEMLNKYRKNVKVLEMKHDYKITGKANKQKNIEYLFIAGPSRTL